VKEAVKEHTTLCKERLLEVQQEFCEQMSELSKQLHQFKLSSKAETHLNKA
jgi:hypothetical protein